jgi:predicted enzyme related to lactoylglutathione lyase
VDDVDEAVKTAVGGGGAVATSPSDNPFGRSAGLFDPEGGLFTVHSEAG